MYALSAKAAAPRVLGVVVFSFEMKLALTLVLLALVAVSSLPGSLTAPANAQPEEPMQDVPPALHYAVDGQEGDDNGGPDILLITLTTVAVFGGAAVLTSLLYLVRRSIGFEPHRPPEGDESGGEEH